MPTAPLLSRAANMYGPLSTQYRDRIRRFFANPTARNWHVIHSCIICPTGRVRTIWQAVMVVDPTFPDYIPQDRSKKPHDRWTRIPDALLVARAIKHATSQ